MTSMVLTPRCLRPSASLLAIIAGTAAIPALSTAQQLVPRPAGAPEVHACPAPGAIPTPMETLHRWDAALDPDVFTPTQIRVSPAGQLVAVNSANPAVVLVDPEAGSMRSVGRRGDGPGEFRSPIDAVLVEEADLLAVADLGGSRVLIYSAEGDFRTSVASPFPVNSIASDGRSLWITPLLMAPRPESGSAERPILARYDLGSGEWDATITIPRALEGEAPFLPFVGARPMVRLSPEGMPFIAFPETYEIWKVDPSGTPIPVIRGCVTEAILEAYRSEGREGAIRFSGRMISDFAVLSGGRTFVRVGPATATGDRYVEMWDHRTGHPLGTLRLEGDFLGTAQAALHPLRPADIQVEWSTIRGETRLFQGAR